MTPAGILDLRNHFLGAVKDDAELERVAVWINRAEIPRL